MPRPERPATLANATATDTAACARARARAPRRRAIDLPFCASFIAALVAASWAGPAASAPPRDPLTSTKASPPPPDEPLVARIVDPRGATVDLARSGVDLARHPPSRAAPGALAIEGENTFRVELQGPPAALDAPLSLLSRGAEGGMLDALVVPALTPIACPTGTPAHVACATTPPLRVAIDKIDREHPAAAGRSIVGELAGAVSVSSGSHPRPLATVRVLGPRETAVGPIDRLRAHLRVRLVRDRAGGGPPFGVDDHAALQLVRRHIASAATVWGQCGVGFGPEASLDVALVDPPPPHMIAVGCEMGTRASGGTVRLRVDGRRLEVATRAGQTPNEVAWAIAAALERAGLRPVVADNQRIAPGAIATSDVVVRRRDGRPALVQPLPGAPPSSDFTLPVCVPTVELTDGLQHFSDLDAVAGSLEERALLRALDDGDPATIEVVFVSAFATAGRVGESFIRVDGSSLSNMIIEDRAGVRAGDASFALAHELGHVLLDVPGHTDDSGPDTPWRLMDSDAADPSAHGPRRLSADECARAVRQSGPRSPSPALVPWPLEPPPRSPRRTGSR